MLFKDNDWLYYIRRQIMQKEVIKKLEDVLALMNDPETTVLDKEVKEKLEKIVVLLDNPGEAASAQEVKEKILDFDESNINQLGTLEGTQYPGR